MIGLKMNNFEDDVFKSGFIKHIPELFEWVYKEAEGQPLLKDDDILNDVLRIRCVLGTSK